MPLSTHNSPVMPDWEGVALVEGILARKRMSLIVGGRGFGKNYRQAQMVREHALRQKVTASPTAQSVASIRYSCLRPTEILRYENTMEARLHRMYENQDRTMVDEIKRRANVVIGLIDDKGK